MFKSQNKKPEDQSKKILNANNEETKRNLCIKQIAYFQYKKTKESCSFDFDKYLLLIKDFETSSSIINKVIWVQTVNEILQVKNISIKQTPELLKVTVDGKVIVSRLLQFLNIPYKPVYTPA